MTLKVISLHDERLLGRILKLTTKREGFCDGEQIHAFKKNPVLLYNNIRASIIWCTYDNVTTYFSFCHFQIWKNRRITQIPFDIYFSDKRLMLFSKRTERKWKIDDAMIEGSGRSLNKFQTEKLISTLWIERD